MRYKRPINHLLFFDICPDKRLKYGSVQDKTSWRRSVSWPGLEEQVHTFFQTIIKTNINTPLVLRAVLLGYRNFLLYLLFQVVLLLCQHFFCFPEFVDGLLGRRVSLRLVFRAPLEQIGDFAHFGCLGAVNFVGN